MLDVLLSAILSSNLSDTFNDGSSSSSSSSTSSSCAQQISSSSSSSSISCGGSGSGDTASSSSSSSYSEEAAYYDYLIAVVLPDFCVCLVAFSFLVSFVTIVLIYKRRKTYPLYIINTNALIATEFAVPFTVWSWTLSYTSPDAPCWFQMLFWDTGLFPIVSFLLYATGSLYIKHQISREKFRENNSQNEDEIFKVRAPEEPQAKDASGRLIKRQLSSGEGLAKLSRLRVVHLWVTHHPMIYVVLVLCVWLESWLAIIPRAFRQLGYWGSSVQDDGCNQYTDFDNYADMVNYAVYTGAAMLSSVFLLRHVKEAFNMKPRLILASLTIFVAIEIYYGVYLLMPADGSIVAGIFIQAVTSIFTAVSIHLYTWFLPLSAVLHSYRYEWKEKRVREKLERDERRRQERVDAAGGGGKQISLSSNTTARSKADSDKKKVAPADVGNTAVGDRGSLSSITVKPSKSVLGVIFDYLTGAKRIGQCSDEDGTRRTRSASTVSISTQPKQIIRTVEDLRQALFTAPSAVSPEEENSSAEVEEDEETSKKQLFILRAFQQYLIQEFCVENIVYLRESQKFKSQTTTEEERKHMTLQKIWPLHFASDCPLEINISQELKAQLAHKVFDEGRAGDVDLWADVDREVLTMLLGPYLRFSMMADEKAKKNKVSSAKSASAGMATKIRSAISGQQSRKSSSAPYLRAKGKEESKSALKTVKVKALGS